MKEKSAGTIVCLSLLVAMAACAPAVTPQPTAAPTVIATATRTLTAIRPAPTGTAPQPTATVLLTPSVAWATHADPTFAVTLQHPAHWQSVAGYDRKYAGTDGFFQLSAISSAGATIDKVAEDDAHHKLQPYGSEPTIEPLQVQGQEARLILPSADQPQAMKGQAGLIVHLPQPIDISGSQYDYLMLWADEEHIRAIAETLELQKPAAQETATLSASQAPDAIQAILFAVAMQFRTRLDQLQLVDWEYVNWPDGCLGVPMRRMCTQAVVPGFRIVVRVEGQEYEYRSDLAGSRFLLAAGPVHGIEKPALIWESADACQTLLLADDGEAAVGPCDAPLTPLRLHEASSRPQQWAELLARFAAFEADTPSGRVVFRGIGQERTTAAWQRAIGAWASLVGRELLFGRSGASWGTALSWQREITDRPGFCQSLEAEDYGVGFASETRCEGGFAQTLGQGWMTNDELEAFDRWFYGKAPLDLPDLRFFGLGAEELSDSEVNELRMWAETLYARLARP